MFKIKWENRVIDIIIWIMRFLFLLKAMKHECIRSGRKNQAEFSKCCPCQKRQLNPTVTYLDYRLLCSESAPWIKEGRGPSIFCVWLVLHEPPFPECQLPWQYVELHQTLYHVSFIWALLFQISPLILHHHQPTFNFPSIQKLHYPINLVISAVAYVRIHQNHQLVSRALQHMDSPLFLDER